MADNQKVRCSSERPSCKRCIRLRRVCSYVPDVASGYVASQSRKASPPPPSYAANLSPGRASISSVKIPLPPFEQQLPRLPAHEHYLGIPKTLLSSLIDVFFSHIYNASLLLRKGDFLDSLAKGTARHHLVLSVCAFAAVYRIHFLAPALCSLLIYRQLLPGRQQPTISP